MVMMDLRDIFRDILGAYRVQFLPLPRQCSRPEASALDFLFRDRLYEDFDYVRFAVSMMDLVPEDGAVDYKDDFGLHYLVFRRRGEEEGVYAFCGPFTYRAYGEEDYERLIRRHSLPEDSSFWKVGANKSNIPTFKFDPDRKPALIVSSNESRAELENIPAIYRARKQSSFEE